MVPVYITIDPEATGENIRMLMDQHGYDINDIRKACGNVSAQAVYKWLSGRSLPSLKNLKVLSYIFKTSIKNILVTDENVFFFSGAAGISGAYFSDLIKRSSSMSQSDLSE